MTFVLQIFPSRYAYDADSLITLDEQLLSQGAENIIWNFHPYMVWSYAIFPVQQHSRSCSLFSPLINRSPLTDLFFFEIFLVVRVIVGASTGWCKHQVPRWLRRNAGCGPWPNPASSHYH